MSPSLSLTRRAEIEESGLLSSLRHVAEGTGTHDLSIPRAGSHQYSVERDVVGMAKEALEKLEHGGEKWL